MYVDKLINIIYENTLSDFKVTIDEIFKEFP